MTRGRHRGHGSQGHKSADDSLWLWGSHAVKAALANPNRRSRKLLLAPGGEPEIQALAAKAKVSIESADPAAIARALPRDAVHQGVALMAGPLEELDVHDAIEGAEPPRRLVLLDQVTDPHNLGAILRSAAAFGACGVIVHERSTPPAGGVLAKAASGALEVVPIVRVINIARTLDELGELGFLRLAFAEEAAESLETLDLDRDVVLVLGAEGEGLRRLTREKCDVSVRLPTGPKLSSLNVSNAAAVGLYACAVARKR
jgi:23S rRNA (guanosine2251-2'-O)-methyltransferase